MSDIEFRQVSKVFGDCIACQDVSLDVLHGHIHAIIGENGAGKSTLMKLLGGLYPATQGTIKINGHDYKPRSAQDAFNSGIAFIHQHFVLAEQMTALQNLELNFTARHNSLRPRNSREITQKAQDLLKKFNWALDLHMPVEELSVGEQQRLEILKALMLNPEVIIFDEPTAVLTPQESEELLQFILDLKKQGKTIIIISHKLNEIKSVADEITVLRQGRLVATHANSEVTIEQMAELMIGRLLQKNKTENRHSNLETLFKIPGTEISLNKGEILGVAGIEGNGQTQLIRNVLNCFKKFNLRYGDITEDRLKLSVFEGMTLRDHMLIRHNEHFSKYQLINFEHLNSETRKLLQEWDVRPADTEKQLSELSGGNQQKFVVGRELWAEPQVLLAAHPTRGVDLGAQEKIHRSLTDYASRQNTVVLLSSDLDEIMSLSDRYIILNKSRIYGPFRRGELNEKQIGLLMASDNERELKNYEAGHL